MNNRTKINNFARKTTFTNSKNKLTDMKKSILSIAAVVMATLFTLASCSDDNEAQSEIPHIASLTLNATTLNAGDQYVGTLHFDKQGSYIKGTYTYTITPQPSENATGTFQAAPVDAQDFTFTAPEVNGTYTITVTCTRVDTYAGKDPYYLGAMSDIGSAKATFTVTGAENLNNN